MVDRFFRSGSGSVALGVAKMAAAIAFLSLIAANWLAATTLTGPLQLADAGARQRLPLPMTDDVDPIVTGSLASAPRLDPCTAALPQR